MTANLHSFRGGIDRHRALELSALTLGETGQTLSVGKRNVSPPTRRLVEAPRQITASERFEKSSAKLRVVCRWPLIFQLQWDTTIQPNCPELDDE